MEQRHYRFKKAMDQALMLRGSRDFASRTEYRSFMRKLFAQLNRGRQDRLQEELKVLRRLPYQRLDACKKLSLRVGPSSTIRVNHNVYSVDSRLIAESVQIRLYAEPLEVWYAQKRVDMLPRQRGEGKHHIGYRHIIGWLVRKPGAFENYRYRDDLFPTHRFRMAYDWLKRHKPSRVNKEYLEILDLAAKESETAVDDALRSLLDQEHPLTLESVEEAILSSEPITPSRVITITEVDLSLYDALLSGVEEVGIC